MEQIKTTEAKLVLVECKPEEASLAISNLNNKIFIKCTGLPMMKTPAKYYKPILISEMENAEVDDWVTDGQRIAQVNVLTINDPNRAKHSKILALPENFSQQHLQMIVSGELKEGDKVLIECEEYPVDMNGNQILYSSVVSSNEKLYPGESHSHLRNIELAANTTDYIKSHSLTRIKLNSSGHITIHKVDEIHNQTK